MRATVSAEFFTYNVGACLATASRTRIDLSLVFTKRLRDGETSVSPNDSTHTLGPRRALDVTVHMTIFVADANLVVPNGLRTLPGPTGHAE